MFGTGISFIGCLITVLDVNAKKVDPSQQNILLGDIIGFFGGVSSALYYTHNKKIVSQMPPLLAISIVMTFSQFFLQTFGCIFISNFEMGFDPEVGTFGYFSKENAVYVLFGVGFIGGALYYCCIAMTLKYFTALVLCTALLF